MKKLFVIATLVGGFCVANAQTTPATNAAPAQTPAKKEAAAPAKKENAKMAEGTAPAAPAKHTPAKHVAAKKAVAKTDAATTTPAAK
jgi:hypothetical protein